MVTYKPKTIWFRSDEKKIDLHFSHFILFILSFLLHKKAHFFWHSLFNHTPVLFREKNKIYSVKTNRAEAWCGRTARNARRRATTGTWSASGPRAARVAAVRLASIWTGTSASPLKGAPASSTTRATRTECGSRKTATTGAFVCCLQLLKSCSEFLNFKNLIFEYTV